MLEPARGIVSQKFGSLEFQKFEDHYKASLIEPINQKRDVKPDHDTATNVVKSDGGAAPERRRRCGFFKEVAKGGGSRQEASEGGAAKKLFRQQRKG